MMDTSRLPGVGGLLEGAAIVTIIGCLLLFWSRSAAVSPDAQVVPSEPIPTNGSAVVGDPNAAVGIIEFSDFECPFCRRFTLDTLPKIRKNFIDTGIVLISFRHLPLAIHESARPLAEAGACAHLMGIFDQAQEKLFRLPLSPRPSGSTIRVLVGIGNERICEAAPDTVIRDEQLAARLGVGATPTFYIGTMDKSGRLRVVSVLDGARPYEAFEMAILASASEARRLLGSESR